MAREYNGTSKKSKIKMSDRANPVEGGAVGHSRPTSFENQQKVNANKPDVKEGRKPWKIEYADDYWKRGYEPVKTGQVRVMDDLSEESSEDKSEEPMFRQLSKRGPLNKKKGDSGMAKQAEMNLKVPGGKPMIAQLKKAQSEPKQLNKKSTPINKAQSEPKQLNKKSTPINKAVKTATLRNNREYGGTSQKAQVQMQSRAGSSKPAPVKAEKKGK